MIPSPEPTTPPALVAAAVAPACAQCGGNLREHPQTHLAVTDQEACVDAALAPLLEALWRAGCRTAFSCEEVSPGRVQIVFADAGSLEVALSLAAGAADTAGDEPLRQRINGHEVAYEMRDGQLLTRREPESALWRISAWPQLWWCAGQEPPLDTTSPLLYEVTFPVFDLPTVTGYLAR